MSARIEKGYVYVLTNDCLKEVDCVFKGERMKVPAVKIGKARTLENRIGTLNTGTYRNFKCHLQVKTDDVKMLEAIIGIALDDYRITEQGRTEFFALPLKEVIRRVKKIAQSLRLEVKFEKRKLDRRSAAAMRSNQRRQRCADASSSGEMWTNKSQLARIIASRGGKIGAADGIAQILRRKRSCPKASKWRLALEAAGLKFDSQNKVINWAVAKNPL